MEPVTIRVHDACPPDESRCVDTGLGEANDAAAPLHEVEALSCFAHAEDGRVVGGAVGRRWGRCCELQQLWVEPARRRQGLGAQLVRAFEARARTHGCTRFYLETYSFQAPSFYAGLGYRQVHALEAYPHGIVRYLLVKQDEPASEP